MNCPKCNRIVDEREVDWENEECRFCKDETVWGQDRDTMGTEHITLPWANKFRDLIEKHKGNEKEIVIEFLVYCYEEEEGLRQRLKEKE